MRQTKFTLETKQNKLLLLRVPQSEIDMTMYLQSYHNLESPFIEAFFYNWQYLFILYHIISMSANN